MMGSPEDEEGRSSVEIQHSVLLTRGYWLADSQVSQALWMSISWKKNPCKFKGENKPVESVSWEHCKEWIRILNLYHESLQATLPTEAQWEYACRAGNQTAYCFGDDPKKLLMYSWFFENSKLRPHPVKQLQPNNWGLYDMHGNVWEWCQDWYSEFAKSSVTDPIGPSAGTQRVVRGGCWDAPARHLRSACRRGIDSGERIVALGFRLLSSDLGAEPSERVMLPKAEPGTERAMPLQVRMKDKETVRTDTFWKSGIKPSWVSDYGKDRYGLWCEFQVPCPDGTRSITQRMRWIKAGEFMMGSSGKKSGRWDDDSPQHRVILNQGYWMADTQVTQELWMAVRKDENPSRLKGKSNPVESVSWWDCKDWIVKICELHKSLNATLPTEAQWEYACRAGSQTAYCFDDDPKELRQYGWFDENAKGKTHPVKQLTANAWGLYDMHGNVWEWCSNRYAQDTKFATSAHTGPVKSTDRVIRGGSWDSPAWNLRSAFRVSFDPGLKGSTLGFRLLSSALGAEPSERAMLPEAEPGTERARIGSAEPVYEFLRSVDLDATGNRSPEEEFSEIDVNAYTSIRVVSDQEGYQFDQLEKPDWAVDFGSDANGLYSVFEVNSVRQRMRWIPPGRFIMGSAEGKDYGRGNEGPEHEVILTHGYWMFDTPVTQGLWTALMGDNPSYFPDPERPVESVGWEEAVGFASRLNELLARERLVKNKGFKDYWERLQFRLPTEAEWEYACRAGTTYETFTEDLKLGHANQTKAGILNSIAWYGGNSGQMYELEKSIAMAWLVDLPYEEKFGGTRKVAQKDANPWGGYDMLGNVWEWCYDWYGEYPTRRETDPTGPDKATTRVIRGGSWSDPARFLRSACRYGNAQGDRNSHLGFRLVSSARQAKR